MQRIMNYSVQHNSELLKCYRYAMVSDSVGVITDLAIFHLFHVKLLKVSPGIGHHVIALAARKMNCQSGEVRFIHLVSCIGAW